MNLLKNEYSLKILFKVFKISKSSYYEFINRKTSELSRNMDHRRDCVKKIFFEYNEIYGARKIKILLEKLNIFVSIKTVSNDLKFLNLKSCYIKKYKPYKSTASSDENCKNILKDNIVDEPLKYVATDITYIKTQRDNWVYLLSFIDLYTRRILHFEVSSKMDSKFVDENTRILIKKYPSIFLIHSDRGSQYTALSYRNILKNAKIISSYSAKGYPYHNAIMESYHASLKIEKLYREKIYNLKHAKKLVFEYNYGFYNTRRIHQSLGYLSPDNYHKQFYKMSMVG